MLHANYFTIIWPIKWLSFNEMMKILSRILAHYVIDENHNNQFKAQLSLCKKISYCNIVNSLFIYLNHDTNV